MGNDENDELDSVYYRLNPILFETPIYTPYRTTLGHYNLEIHFDSLAYKNEKIRNRTIEGIKQILGDKFVSVDELPFNNIICFTTGFSSAEDTRKFERNLSDYTNEKNEIIGTNFYIV